MELKVYAVYDSKIEAFQKPIFMETRGAALRAWNTVVNDQKTEFYQYPGDFTLFEIGSYNMKTGQMSQYENKTNLGTALEFKKENPNEIRNEA